MSPAALVRLIPPILIAGALLGSAWVFDHLSEAQRVALGPRAWALLALPAAATLALIGLRAGLRGASSARSELVVCGLVGFLVAVHGLFLAQGLGRALNLRMAVPLAAAALLLGIAPVVAVLEPGSAMGLRVAATLESEPIWRESHRRLAVGFALSAAATAGAVLLGSPTVALAALGIGPALALLDAAIHAGVCALDRLRFLDSAQAGSVPAMRMHAIIRPRTLLLAAAFAGALAQRPAPAHAKGTDELLLGYVNLQRAILEVDEGKRAKSSLKATFEKKQKALAAREEELLRMKEGIEKEAAVKNDDATRQRVLEFQNKLLELKQVYMKEQSELQELEQRELAGITAKMRKIVEEIGAAGQYTMILEVQDSRLLFAKPHLDLTNEVIRKYNAKHK